MESERSINDQSSNYVSKKQLPEVEDVESPISKHIRQTREEKEY